MATLSKILSQLESTKITTRQAGLVALQDYFTKEHHVLNLDEEGNCKAWIVVFQKLFTCVQREKEEVLKKNASSAIDRLGKAASAVRWLIGKCRHLLNSKAVKVLNQHLMKYLVHRGELHTPVALDYIKALRSILSWKPHMDHLDSSTWCHIVRLAFNVVLKDPLTADLKYTPADAEDYDIQSMNSDMYEDDEEREDELDDPQSSLSSRKRRRGASQGLPTPKKMRGTSRTQHQTVSLEQIEFLSLLPIMLKSSSAPLLSSDDPELPSALLQRFDRFLKVYPTDTSLRHDYLLALSATLNHLSLNRVLDVVQFAANAWGGLVSMWDSKNKNMKEALVGVLIVLFPFVSASESQGHGGTSLTDGVHKLWKLLDGEAASRQGTDGLSLGSLRLDSRGEVDGSNSAFVAATFRFGYNFDASQALAWAILELQADCIAKVTST
jgi:serine-protein kinase ATM